MEMGPPRRPRAQTPLLLLEFDAEFANHGILAAPYVRDDSALPPHTFDTGVNERDWTPDQIDVGRHQLLVRDDRLRRSDQLRGDLVIGVTKRRSRPQFRQPEMLVAEHGAEFPDRLYNDTACRGQRRRDCKVIGRQRSVDVVVDITADPFADSELPDDVVLFPAEPAGFDVAGNPSAIADELLADEAAVAEVEIAQHKPEIDMTPRLRPVGGEGEVRRGVFGGITGQGTAQSG